jgi:hypothetical protein
MYREKEFIVKIAGVAMVTDCAPAPDSRQPALQSHNTTTSLYITCVTTTAIVPLAHVIQFTLIEFIAFYGENKPFALIIIA